MELSDWIPLVGVLAGSAAFVVGLVQYITAQKWKRAEFVSKAWKEFISRSEVSAALHMLDWNARKYPIDTEKYPKETLDSDGASNFVTISDNAVRKALVHHSERSDGFRYVEVYIRDVFDVLFECMEEFEKYMIADLVSPTEFEPYLSYWLDLIGNPENREKSEEFRHRIWEYIDSYGYTGVQHLFLRYGYNIKPAKPTG